MLPTIAPFADKQMSGSCSAASRPKGSSFGCRPKVTAAKGDDEGSRDRSQRKGQTEELRCTG